MLNLEGRELGGCELIRVVGEGGMGEVYLAEQTTRATERSPSRSCAPMCSRRRRTMSRTSVSASSAKSSLAANFNNPNILQVYYSGSRRNISTSSWSMPRKGRSPTPFAGARAAI